MRRVPEDALPDGPYRGARDEPRRRVCHQGRTSGDVYLSVRVPQPSEGDAERRARVERERACRSDVQTCVRPRSDDDDSASTADFKLTDCRPLRKRRRFTDQIDRCRAGP